MTKFRTTFVVTSLMTALEQSEYESMIKRISYDRFITVYFMTVFMAGIRIASKSLSTDSFKTASMSAFVVTS